MSVVYLSKLSKASYSLVKRIGQLADEQGVSVYLVGGFVRDLILGRKHLDLDFVVEGDAAAFAKNVGCFLKSQEVRTHSDFGTASVVLPEGLVLDFATCRSECYAAPGRLPDIHPGTLQEDLFRRDFTINAMALQINQDKWSKLVDHFGGFKDLRAKKIRILHDQSFIDDPTRILRAIRFEQRFQFAIESKTLELLKARLKNRSKDQASTQRFFNEFKKMLGEERAVECLDRCRRLKADGLLHPEFNLDLKAVKAVHKRWPQISRRFNIQQSDRWKMLMMAVAEVQEAKIGTDFGGQLSLTAQDRRNFLEAETSVDFCRKLCQNALSSSAVYRLLKPLAQEQCLYLCCRCDSPVAIKRIERFLKKDSKVVLGISGHDATALGVKGSRIKSVLDQVLDRKIDKGFSSRAEELNFLKKIVEAEA